MIGVQENGEIVFLAQAPDQRGDLPNSQEFTLAFGRSHDDRGIAVACAFKHGLQRDPVRDVEMTDCNPLSLRVLQDLV